MLMLDAYPMCEICGEERSVELNHCLFHPRKSYSLSTRKLLDTAINCQMICKWCHEIGAGHFNITKENHWAKRLSEKYSIEEWWQLIDIPGKERFD